MGKNPDRKFKLTMLVKKNLAKKGGHAQPFFFQMEIIRFYFSLIGPGAGACDGQVLRCPRARPETGKYRAEKIPASGGRL
jgi:hypothetical protein